MDWSRRFARWTGWHAKPVDTTEPDAADMGTAYGLDASFERADSLPAEPADAGAPPPWTNRLIRRSGL